MLANWWIERLCFVSSPSRLCQTILKLPRVSGVDPVTQVTGMYRNFRMARYSYCVTLKFSGYILLCPLQWSPMKGLPARESLVNMNGLFNIESEPILTAYHKSDCLQ
jgi:hypothetical protein